jgi:hypothetical protein
MKLFGIINVGFDITDQLLLRFPACVRYWRKKNLEFNKAVPQIFIDFKEGGREGGGNETSQVD